MKIHATQSSQDIELQQYLFDLNGYVVLENVLSNKQISLLNHLVDQELPAHGELIGKQMNRFGAAPSGSGFLAWGEPFCNLLTHPQIMSVLRFRLGDCFRIDRVYGISMHLGMEAGELHADYGATAPIVGGIPGEYYPFRENNILEGFVVASFNLTDSGPDYGGFCCIPGSHKSHYKLPQQIRLSPETAQCVVIPEVPAGSAILFTEALTHSTTAWRGNHERRSLLYKYCISHLSWTAERVTPPEGLSERQRILFRNPADPHRHFPSLFHDTAAPLETGYH